MSKMITTNLENICDIGKGAIISGPFGSNISSKFFVDEGVPVIRGNNLSLSLDKFYDEGFVFVSDEKANELNCDAYKGDLIFTAAGTIGQVGIIPEDSQYDRYVISNKQIRARIDSQKVNLLYAYYWFSSPWIQKTLAMNNKGSTVPLLTLQEVKQLPIAYPEDLYEQYEVVQILEKISSKINNNIKINSELESMAKTIYDYWFLQFEFPNEEGNPYKSSGGKMVWSKELKKEIPEGWEIRKFKNVFDFVKGKIPKDLFDAPNNECVKYLTIEALNGGVPQYCEKKFMTMTDGEVLMIMDGAASGEVYVGGVGVIGSTLCKLQIIENYLENNFLYIVMKSLEDVLKKVNTGSTVPHANKTYISNFSIAMPIDDTIRRKMQEDICLCINQISQHKRENEELIALRKFLLPLLMNGQVGFKE